MKTPFLNVTLAILRKDLRAELRSRELIATMGLFALLSVLIFSFALELDRPERRVAVSGVLWVTLVFASFLGLNRSMAMEREGGNIDAMLIAPIDRTTIFVGKLLGNLLFTLVIGFLLLPLMTILYDMNMVQPWVIATVFLGVLGIATSGTLLSALTAQTRSRETLLPIVMLPIILPMLLSAVRATNGIIADDPMQSWIGWPQIMIVINLVYSALCLVMFQFVIEE